MTETRGLAHHTGQFVLSQDTALAPDGWDVRNRCGWTLATCRLPVLDVVDRHGRRMGWALGHLVDDGVLTRGPLRLDTDDLDRVDWVVVDALLERLAGRFVLVLLPASEPTVLLDAYGSLAAVHDPSRRAVASVPALLGRGADRVLAETTGFPDTCSWLPFGLTLSSGVHRLQANQSLDLRSWTTRRRWSPPLPGADADALAGAEAILSGLRCTIEAVAREHPVNLSLTGGRDSRVVLAAARGVLERATFFTLGADTYDTHLADRLAARHGLRHLVLPPEETSPEEMDSWLTVTGHAIGGELWRVHASLARLDPAAALLPGTAGEVGRAHTHRPGDPEDGQVTPEVLLQRLRVPQLPIFLDGAERWLSDLPNLPFATVLELAYIEQRLSCWAGPGHYGNRTSAFELSPFASRALFSRALSLPLGYRRREQLSDDVIRMAWPELAKLPFNRLPGARGAVEAIRRQMRSSRRA